jgi:hypothetical protein
MNEKKRPAKRVRQETKVPARPTVKKKQQKREGKSIRWMVIALLIAVAFTGWALAAASYASDVEEFARPDMPMGRGRGAAVHGGVVWMVGGLARVLWNSVVQIPNAHRVASHTVRQHPVLFLMTALVAGGVGLFGWWMSRLERQFAKEDERFRRLSADDL